MLATSSPRFTGGTFFPKLFSFLDIYNSCSDACTNERALQRQLRTVRKNAGNDRPALAAMNAFNRLGEVKDIGGQTIGINGAMA